MSVTLVSPARFQLAPRSAGSSRLLEEVAPALLESGIVATPEQRRAQREAERQQRAYERALAAQEKEQKRLYLESRAAEVEAMNDQLDAFVTALESLLVATLKVDDHIDFESLKEKPEPLPFAPGDLATAALEPRISAFLPPEPSALARLVPGAKGKHERAVADAHVRFEQATAAHADTEGERKKALAQVQKEYDEYVAALEAQAQAKHRVIEEIRGRFDARDPDAITWYFSAVLDASVYPTGFPKKHRLAFVPESRQLVVEYELPPVSIVPTTRRYRYIRARDAVEEGARPQTQIRALYAQIVAQTALRALHELFEADRTNALETLVLNCYVDTVNAATGQPARPHLVTVRSSKDQFAALDLAHVEPTVCLKGLNAAVSRSPHELVPVRPIVEFNMVDPRFIQESDVLGALDQRPNLMELTPTEFESLISNLFEKMGLETRQTQASRDGGVDCLAYDPRPIFGGKVVIQAKRYKNTVGVSAVRDLFGTMQNEGASKGILVTTSGYGKSSFEFADGKPLELLSGSNLLYLLSEYADIEARIEAPEDWVDPTPYIEVDEPAVTRILGDHGENRGH
jgi:restriction system protein